MESCGSKDDCYIVATYEDGEEVSEPYKCPWRIADADWEELNED